MNSSRNLKNNAVQATRGLAALVDTVNGIRKAQAEANRIGDSLRINADDGKEIASAASNNYNPSAHQSV